MRNRERALGVGVWAGLALVLVTGCKGLRPGASVGEEACVPGETLIIGCAEECGLGRCQGFASIRVCDGALGIGGCRDADSSMSVQINGNSCGGDDGTDCPRGRVICPPSASVIVAPSGLFDDWSCEWAVEHRGILPPGGRAGEIVTCTPGETYEVGCSQACGIGECAGSPSLRVCDGAVSIEECARDSTTQLMGGTSFAPCPCPRRVVRCPDSGRMTVAPRTEGADQLCEWEARLSPHRADGNEVCSPGQRIEVSCSTCAAETFIRVCDGNLTPEGCNDEGASYLAEQGDECPEATVTCPGSGAVTVVSWGWGEDQPFACDWAVREAGLGE